MRLLPAKLFVGIDGGGSKCCATLYHSEQGLLSTAIAGPANPLHGFQRTLNSIQESCQLALTKAGLTDTSLDELVVGAGLAGVNLPSMEQKMRQWQHPFAQFHLTTDLHIACLGAHGNHDGAIVICGTGSCGFAIHQQQSTRLGGHGFPYGDKASGAWLGMEAFKAVLLHKDDAGPYSSLTEKLLQHFDVTHDMALVECLAKQPSSEYAKLARFVFEAASTNDEVALALIKEGADYLSQLIIKLHHINGLNLPVAVIGGLADSYYEWLDPSAKACLVEARHSPEMGALQFAQSQQS
ncbi:ATPase [Paraferrimonas haliotis]|uniref:ATPase n=1 Tax=Paraferrimonas haliotis TaxID=2013866 RepID=A0AA37TR66_9GAMM|nr:ATPase [Paraferrimonas haliotis]